MIFDLITNFNERLEYVCQKHNRTVGQTFQDDVIDVVFTRRIFVLELPNHLFNVFRSRVVIHRFSIDVIIFGCHLYNGLQYHGIDL